MDEWRQNFLQSSPMFEPLRGVGKSIEKLDRWPTLAELNALLSSSVKTAHGAPVRFVPQSTRAGCIEEKYEIRIYLTGEIQTRTENWHDLFNALVWLAFPEIKTAINALHYANYGQDNEGNRGKMQDALTLFDESGVIVACADDELAGLLQDFQWHQLFWKRRQDVIERMKFVLFGHSLYEKALRPYVGFTGKGLMLKVEKPFLRSPSDEQGRVLDSLIYGYLQPQAEVFSRLDFSPVPLLGVPGWWADNKWEVFYGNSDYFRAGRFRRMQKK